MKMTNLKNIVIGALVVINVFFLVYYLWGVIGDRASKAETLGSLCAVFRQNGIGLLPENIHEGGVLQMAQTSRDYTAEQQLADTLLKNASKAIQGSIYTYTGENGQAVFKNGGDFNITLKAGTFNIGGDAVNTAKKLLKTMSIETNSVEAAGERGDETVTAVCTYNNQTVFNCRIILTFKNGSLLEISGKRAEGIRATEDKTNMFSSTTALMTFLSEVKNGNLICTKISLVEFGYKLSQVSVSGGGSLRAVWSILTDSGVYYVDAETGDVEQVA